jgi:uncharacterized protein YggE
MMTWRRKTKWMLALAGVGVVLMALACSMAGTRAMVGGQQLGAASGKAPSAEKTAPNTVASSENGTQRDVNQLTPNGKTEGILVAGQGTASSAPDLAIVTLGVEATGETIKEARNSAASALGKIIDTLLESEIAEKDIQTSRLSIHPKYSTRTVTRCPEAEGASGASSGTVEGSRSLGRVGQADVCYEERQRVITGYEVNNQLVVRLRDLDTVGDVIDDVTDAGGDLTRFQGISFSLEDTGPLKDKALTAAIEDAQGKAAHVADVSGVTLGELIRISEASAQFGSPYGRFSGAAFAMLEAASSGDAPTSIEGGLVTVRAIVEAMYDIE